MQDLRPLCLCLLLPLAACASDSAPPQPDAGEVQDLDAPRDAAMDAPGQDAASDLPAPDSQDAPAPDAMDRADMDRDGMEAPDAPDRCPQPAPCQPGERSCLSNIHSACALDAQGCPVERLRDCNQEALLCTLSAPEGCAAPGDTDLEPNQSPEQASPLPQQARQAGAITGPQDEDWYQIQVEQPGALRVELTRDDSRGALQLQVCAPAQQPGCQGAPSLEAQDEPARHLEAVQAPGTWWVRVRAGATKPYVLRVDALPWQQGAQAWRFSDAPPLDPPRALAAAHQGEPWLRLELGAPGRLYVDSLDSGAPLFLCHRRFPGACDAAHNLAQGDARLQWEIPEAGPVYLWLPEADTGRLWIDTTYRAEPCAPGQHQGGEGCQPLGQCSPGYWLDGDGACAPLGQCAPGAIPGQSACQGWEPGPALEAPIQGGSLHQTAQGGLWWLPADPSQPGQTLDPQTWRWEPTPGAPVALQGHTPCPLPDGRVLLVGGQPVGGAISDEQPPTLIFDPEAQRWSTGAPQPTLRQQALCAVLNEQEVLVALGGEQTQVDIYNHQEGRWRQAAPLELPRAGGQGISLGQGRVLLVGAQQGPQATTAEVYDANTDTWEATRPLDAPHPGAALLLLPDGSVLAIAGQRGANASALVGAWLPQENRWTQRASLPRAIAAPQAVVLPGGAVLVMGEGEALTEIYDPMRDQWSQGPGLHLGRQGGLLQGSAQGAWVVGGQSTQGGDAQRHPEQLTWPR